MGTDYKKLVDYILVSILFLIGMYLFPIRVVGTDFAFIPGDMGDARFNNIVLEHGYNFITGKVDSYWNALYMYPTDLVIARSDNLLGSMPMYALFRFIGYEQHTSFQLWFVLLQALNFLTCFWAGNKLFKSPLVGAILAYIFAFGLFNITQLNHAQVFPRFMIPLIFYWTIKFFQEKKWVYFSGLLVGTVYQFYCGIYLGFFTLYSLMFLFISYFIVYRDTTIFRAFNSFKKLIPIIITIISSAILLYVLFKPYLVIAEETGVRSFAEIIDSIPRPSSYVMANPSSLVWKEPLSYPFFESFNLWWTHFLFSGALSILGVFSAIYIYFFAALSIEKKKLLKYLIIANFLALAFCLNFNGFTLYRVIYEIPGFHSMRALNRIINTQVVFFLFNLGFVLYYLITTFKWGKHLVYLFIPLVVLDNYFTLNFEVLRFKKMESIQQVDNIKSELKNYDYKNFEAISYELKDKSSYNKIIEGNISVMMACQELNVRSVNGYSGSNPHQYLPYFDSTDITTLTNWLNESNTPIDRVLIIPR